MDYPKDCFLKGDYEAAANSCRKLLENPAAGKLKGDISYLLGLSLLKLERFLESRSYFNDVLLAENEDLKKYALMGIGDSYFLEKNYDKAYGIYNQILAEYPESQITPMVYYRLGQTLSKMDRVQEAKYYLDKVPREFPFSFEARLSMGFFNEDNSCGVKPAVNNDYYSVQSGCLNKKDNADQACEKLVKEGFDAYVLEAGNNNDGPSFRVRAGRFHSKEEAKELEKRLKRAGYPTKICP